jgi:hypothetical protein
VCGLNATVPYVRADFCAIRCVCSVPSYRKLWFKLAVQNLLDIAFFSHGSVADYSHIEDYEGVRGFQAPGRDIRLIAS